MNEHEFLFNHQNENLYYILIENLMLKDLNEIHRRNWRIF